MNKVLDSIFEVTNDLELTQKLIGILINMVEKKDIQTLDDAMYFANQQDTIDALLHIALDYVFNSKASLEKLQDKNEGGANA